MASLNGGIDPVGSLGHGRDNWRIRIRVLRMWEMCPISEPSKPFAVQLVLLDAEGNKIKATIRKSLIRKLFGEVVEGKIYRISYFAVVANARAYKVARHEFKILFNSRTKIVPDESLLIPSNGFPFMNTHEIFNTGGDCEYLIDIIGLLTAVSREKQYTKGANITRMIELELTDESYVDIIVEFLAADGGAMPVVILEFAKIKTYKGNIVIQNVMHATSIMRNPQIPEVVSLRNSLALVGMDPEKPIGDIEDDVHFVFAEEEFTTMFPWKSLEEIHATAEVGTFVVQAKVSSILEGEKWWYSVCRCHRAVTLEDEVYYCYGCDTQVLEVIPRFRLKVEVSDGVEEASFVIFDSDCQNLLKKTCKELVVFATGKASDSLPDVLKEIVGREFLFKIEKTSDHGTKYDDSFKVKNVYEDDHVMQLFKNRDRICTPTKAVAAAKFSSLDGGPSGEKSTSFFGKQSGNISELSCVAQSLEDISPDGAFTPKSPMEIHVADDVPPRAAKRLKLVISEKV